MGRVLIIASAIISLFVILQFRPADAAPAPAKQDTDHQTPGGKKETRPEKQAPGENQKPVDNKKAEPGEEKIMRREGDDYAKLPLGPDGKPRPLSLKEAVRLVLKNNVDLRLQQLEILKSDTELKKDESKYAPIVGLSYQGLRKIDKPTGNTVFSGTKVNSDTVAASVSKLFSSGTYFQVEVSDNRFDSNAGEGPGAVGILARLAQPPLHTGALKVVLRQELVKNAFGYSQRRLNQIARNNSAIQREELIYNLSQLIVKTMVDYWSLAIAEENLNTAAILLDNTRNIRAITARKRRIGLAETFEVNQWNALVAQSEGQVKGATLERDNARRNILRTLNLPPNLPISGATELSVELPTDLNRKQDLLWALRTRPDLKNLRLRMVNARTALELAKNNRLPSVTIGGSFAHRDNGRYGNSAFREVPSGKYPEYGVEFKVEYPLWDEGTKVDVRNARVSLRQLAIQERKLQRQVRDEIFEGLERITVSHEILQKALQTEAQTRAFYFGLVRRYRQGRFTAVAVKNALDALAQSRQALIQAKINYNISLVRYELTRNAIFRKFDVDINEVLNRIKLKNN